MQGSWEVLSLTLAILLMIFSISWFIIKISAKIIWKIGSMLIKILAWATMFPGTKYAN